MSRLPGSVTEALKRRGVVASRYGRGERGRPTLAERRWYFCGWYWHVEAKGRVLDGPHGPFPCGSAALADAADRLGVREAGRPARPAPAEAVWRTRKDFLRVAV